MEFNLPKREYCDGEKKLATWRLPEPLLTQLEKISKERGWNMTDVVITALDQFCQWDAGQKKKKSPPGYRKK